MAGYEEVRGIFGEDDMREVIGGMRVLFVGCGTDHLPEIGPAGLPFLTQPPPNPRRAENGNGKRPATRKKNDYF